jgi:GTP cyclohydrolase I
VGLSKIARSLDYFARRPQIQERLTFDFASLFMRVLQPLGVMVVVEAEHTCITTRGALKPGSKTTTSCVLGVFEANSDARNEVLSLINS